MNDNQIYIVTVLNSDYERAYERIFCIGMNNVHKLVNQLKKSYPNCSIHCNKAVTSFDGGLVNGDYVKSF